jgi:hypothetical protein
MVHRATLRATLGRPAVTTAQALESWDFDPDSKAFLHAGTPRKIAYRRLHVLDELQAWGAMLGDYRDKVVAAHNAMHHNATLAAAVRRCPHLASCDPQQSSCHEFGVEEVRNGVVRQRAPEVVIPWEQLERALAPEAPSLRWAILVVHGQWRMHGVPFRLLSAVRSESDVETLRERSLDLMENTAFVTFAWSRVLSAHDDERFDRPATADSDPADFAFQRYLDRLEYGPATLVICGTKQDAETAHAVLEERPDFLALRQPPFKTYGSGVQRDVASRHYVAEDAVCFADVLPPNTRTASLQRPRRPPALP